VCPPTRSPFGGAIAHPSPSALACSTLKCPLENPLQATGIATPVTGNTEQTRPENRAFFPALDGLRAFAFLLVFFHHYWSLPWGWAGVNIFFVLSGFLITGILYDTRNDLHRARNFYLRRTLRIFPLYYGIFLALLLAEPVFHWLWSPDLLAWPLYLGNYLRFLSPTSAVMASPLELAADFHLRCRLFPGAELYLGHFWSLCVEEQFYLFWPWVVFWVASRRKLIWICAFAVIATPLLRVLVQHQAPGWMLDAGLLDRATPFQLDALLLGGLLALLWRGSATDRDRLLALGRVVAMLASLAAILYLAFTVHVVHSPHWYLSVVYPTWIFTWGTAFINLLTAAMILCCLRPQMLIARVFRLSALRWLGRISYGAYVFHDILHGLFFHLIKVLSHHSAFVAAHDQPLAITLAFVVTLCLAWFSFRFFESPFLNLKDRWTVRG
jgi:peptidoglycan/LPS O-acetylase OafA/YrhL